MHQKQITIFYKNIEIRLKSRNQANRLFMPACKVVKVWVRYQGDWHTYMEKPVASLIHGDAIDNVLNTVKKRIDRHLIKEGG